MTSPNPTCRPWVSRYSHDGPGRPVERGQFEPSDVARDGLPELRPVGDVGQQPGDDDHRQHRPAAPTRTPTSATAPAAGCATAAAGPAGWFVAFQCAPQTRRKSVHHFGRAVLRSGAGRMVVASRLGACSVGVHERVSVRLLIHSGTSGASQHRNHPGVNVDDVSDKEPGSARDVAERAGSHARPRKPMPQILFGFPAQ